MFDYMCAGSFQTDGGIPVMFGGYCGGYADEEITDVRGFIERAYYDTVGQTFSSYFLSMLMYLPVLVFVPIAAGLLMWGIGKLVKDGWDNTFGGCYKIVNSFVWVSALLSALAVFAGGWLTAARVMYMLIPALFGGILIVRTAIYCIMTAIGNKKSLDTVERDKKEEIFGGIL